MKKLLALLFALLATPAAAQTIPSGAWGSINYWGVGGLSQVLAPGLAGQCLTSQNVGSAPIWVNCQVSSLSLLPPIGANSIMANNTLNFVAPQAIDVNRVLDMVGYDIIRPPVAESIIYKSNVGPNFNWQTLPPSTTGSLLTSGGPTNPPFWAPSAAQGNLAAICQTVGAVLYFDTPSLLWKCLNPGTSGQLLQTGGAAGNPSWLTVTLATLGGVPSSRNINTTAPLSGGGALSADLTLSCTTCATTGGVQRTRLTGNADYYVRRDGNDSNTGTANSAGGAWLTLNKALAFISQTIDFNGFNIVVHAQGANVGDGTYTENLITPDWVGWTGSGFGQWIVQAENGTGTITGATATATILSVGTASPIQFKNFVLANANASGVVVEGDDGGFVALNNITFGSTGAGGSLVSVTQSAGRVLFIASTFTMQSGLTTGTGFVGRSGGEVIFQPGVTINYVGATTFSNAVADFATLASFDNTGSTFSGTVPTGKPYVLSRDTLGLITFPNLITGSAGATFTPMQVPNGGTGQVSWTSGGIPCANTAVTLASSGALLSNAVVYGGGAGGCPSTGAAGTNGQLLLGVTGSPPAMATMSQDCTITNAGVITCLKTNNVAFTGLATASIPLSVANGGTGETGTAWTAFTPSPSCGTATITSASARAKTIGKTTHLQGDFTITAIGTCAVTNIGFNLPNTAQSFGALVGREATGNKGIDCVIFASGTTGNCLKADATAWLVNDHLQFSGSYENQ